MPRKLIKDMTPEEHQRIQKMDRERWNRRKDDENAKRRTGVEYPASDAMEDENGVPLKGFKKNHNVRTKEKYKRWTEDQIVELGTRLLEWMEADVSRIFWSDFFIEDEWGKEQVYYADICNYLGERSEIFSNLYSRVSLIEQSRLLKMGFQPKQNTNFLEFLLVNKTDMKSRNHKETTNNNLTLNQAPTKIQLLPPQENKVIDMGNVIEDITGDMMDDNDNGHDDLNDDLNDTQE